MVRQLAEKRAVGDWGRAARPLGRRDGRIDWHLKDPHRKPGWEATIRTSPSPGAGGGSDRGPRSSLSDWPGGPSAAPPLMRTPFAWETAQDTRNRCYLVNQKTHTMCFPAISYTKRGVSGTEP